MQRTQEYMCTLVNYNPTKLCEMRLLCQQIQSNENKAPIMK